MNSGGKEVEDINSIDVEEYVAFKILIRFHEITI